ncbi:MAG TPA: Gfo/Idh/MocA family oxidoreductase [Candidatus Angelobacter sp.]|nr:Gfo/Idh/MocA family oxidoreductase [Candidatus Angelobacter sp.]
MDEKTNATSKPATRNDNSSDQSKGLTRRKFLSGVATSSAAAALVPRHVLGRGFTPPSDKLNIASVGVGGMGRSNLINLANQNIVALCDVDWGYADKGFANMDTEIQKLQARLDRPGFAPAADEHEEFDPVKANARLAAMMQLKTEHLPRAKRYKDYREMLERQKDIDAVVVATSDHMHAPIALAAMELGKHVYVQKPLTWSVEESRKLARRAKETKVATQMGNQGHSLDDARMAVEYIWADAIGDVREVHVWTNRPLGFWPQGVPRPEALKEPAETLRWNGQGVNARLAAALAGNYPVPDTLEWDLFLGAAAPDVQYHPLYHPFNWRGWVDWGVGAIGDMGAHLIDHSMWALNLGMPTSVETVSTPFNGVSYPHATMTFYEFPARGPMPPVRLTWYDGGLMPHKPEELGDEELKKEGGALLVGSKGKLLHETYGKNPRLLPKSLHDSAGKPAQKLPRIAGEAHEMNWVDAAKGKAEASCPFEYAARLTEVMLLGIVALRAGSKIYYDGANMRVTNSAQANDYLRREYRQGWSV